MKLNIIIKIVFITLFINACTKSSKSDVQLPPSEVKITLLKSILPSALFFQKAAYFRDKKGKDIRINLTFTESKEQLRLNDGFEYTRENGYILYENKELRILTSLDLSSQLSYELPTAPAYSIFASNIINDHADELLNSIITVYDANTNKMVVSESLAIQKSEEIILGKTFKNVFHSTYANDFYKNQLGFNTTYGVVSLNDFDGNLYVFDRFE